MFLLRNRLHCSPFAQQQLLWVQGVQGLSSAFKVLFMDERLCGFHAKINEWKNTRKNQSGKKN
jgi:hypothetical protein